MKENWMWYALKRRQMLRGVLWENPALGWSRTELRVLLNMYVEET
jgi:hypothetical protein